MKALTLAFLLAGCGGATEPETMADDLPPGAFWCSDAPDASWCPIGSTCLPSGNCWNAATGYDDTDAGCNPVACESYWDWAIYLHGGECPEDCAAACNAACAGDTDTEQYSLAEAASLGCPKCEY